MFQLLEIAEITVGKKTNHCVNFSFNSLRNNMDPDKYFSGYNLKNSEKKQSLGILKKCAIWTGNFYCKSCSLHNS